MIRPPLYGNRCYNGFFRNKLSTGGMRPTFGAQIKTVLIKPHLTNLYTPVVGPYSTIYFGYMIINLLLHKNLSRNFLAENQTIGSL